MENGVRVFDSFEEADAADREGRARMTRQQRAEVFFQLRERFYANVFAKGMQRVCRVLELDHFEH